MKNGGKVILGIMAGLATGALMGILFAPAKGSKTRKRIVKKTNDYVDEVGTRLHSMVDGVAEKLHTAREDAEEAVERVKARAKRVKDDIEATANHKA